MTRILVEHIRTAIHFSLFFLLLQTQTYFIRRFENKILLSTLNWNFVNKRDWKFNFDFMFDAFCTHSLSLSESWLIIHRMNGNFDADAYSCALISFDFFTQLIGKQTNHQFELSHGFFFLIRFSCKIDTWFDTPSVKSITDHLHLCVYLLFALAHFHSTKKKIIFILWQKNCVKTYFSTGYFIVDSFHYFAVVFDFFPSTHFNLHKPSNACQWFQQNQLKLGK